MDSDKTLESAREEAWDLACTDERFDQMIVLQTKPTEAWHTGDVENAKTVMALAIGEAAYRRAQR